MANPKSIGVARGEIEVKRFCLDGVTLRADCPKCNRSLERKLDGTSYLSYPMANEPFTEGFWCEDCDEEFTHRFILKVSIEVAE